MASMSRAPTAESHAELAKEISRTADAQLSSTFFGKLPAELRIMIYIEFWRLSGLHQHVGIREYVGNDRAPSHMPCTVGAEYNDVRIEHFQRADPAEADMWWRRLKSGWAVHWECEELAESGGVEWSPFLSVLLACKRLFVVTPAPTSMYASLTILLAIWKALYQSSSP